MMNHQINIGFETEVADENSVRELIRTCAERVLASEQVDFDAEIDVTVVDADAIRAISSIGLAHLGDAVYELLVRTYLCAHGKATGKGLHRATVELVRAPKQAELADAIFGELTDEEHDVFRRGRNANVHTIPHSADRAQYQKATALEALFGWLYLQGRHERINELFNRMMEANDAA